MLQATVVHDQHHEVDTLDSNLQSPTSTADRHKCGSAPAFWRTTGRHTTTVLGTEDEACFEHIGHNDDALGPAQYFLRNSFVGRRHNRLQNIHGFPQAIHCVFAIRTSPRERSDQADHTHQYQRDYLFHELFLCRSAELRGDDFRWADLAQRI